MQRQDRQQRNVTESACQRRGVSCGACCGIFNLQLNPAERTQLLADRERAFRSVRADFSLNESYVAYRTERESLERKIPRSNPEVYVCPFFGYLDDEMDGNGFRRTGCMVHPTITGREKSQDFSFYGTSICQAYDCRNKERDELQGSPYSRLLAELFGPSAGEPGDAPGGMTEAYARLMADLPFYAFLERLCEFGGGVRTVDSLPRAPFERLCRARLDAAISARITSFELPERSYRSAAADRSEVEDSLRAGLRDLCAPDDGAQADRPNRFSIEEIEAAFSACLAAVLSR